MSMLFIYTAMFLIFVAVSIPVAFALGLSTAIIFAITDQPLALFSQRLWTGLDKFSLVAIPFFILAGELMSGSGILARLMDMARFLFGRIRGGLLYINILVSMFFGGVNGSAVADTSAVGSLMIKATKDEYNDPEMAAAVTACSSIVGPIIPPSLPMLIYAFAASNVSIAGMFLAGIIPGILLGLAMMAVTFFISRKKGYAIDTTKYGFVDGIRILRRFTIAAVLPVIMVVGIVGGIVTPTEAGCLGILYALGIGFFVTRELTLQAVYLAVKRTVIISTIVLIMISVANTSTWWLTIEGVPEMLSTFFLSITDKPLVFLLLMLVFYVLIGMFIEQAAAMVMLVPVLAPLATQYGIEPIHFGLFTCLALAFGLVTPPVGLCLFISSSIARVPVQSVFRASTPYLIAIFAVILIVTCIPSIFLWLPALFDLR